MTDATTDTLLGTAGLGPLRLRNRVLLAPMTRISANPDGTIPRRMEDYYRRFAVGGFSALITEGSYIDSEHSQTYFDQPGLAREDHVGSWRRVTEAAHAAGAAVIAQLQHSGPQSQGNPHTSGVLGPSAIPAKGEQLPMYRGSGPYARPAAMSLADIAAVRRAFVNAALRARRAGFDGVEIHGANGYLLDAFHTDYFNARTDDYGGSPRNRVRLSTEIAADIRSALGEDYVVGIRISQAKVSDSAHRWSGPDEAETIFGLLGRSGIDYIHTTEWKALEPAFPGQDFRSLARIAKESAPTTTIIANGHIDLPATARAVLDTEQAGFVAVGRAALSNRDWPLRARRNEAFVPPFDPHDFGGLATLQEWETNS